MKSFIVVLEQGRERGKISGSLYQIKANKPQRISDWAYSQQSNGGANTEAVKALVTFGALSKKDAEARNYNILLIEGRGVNYINHIGK